MTTLRKQKQKKRSLAESEASAMKAKKEVGGRYASLKRVKLTSQDQTRDLFINQLPASKQSRTALGRIGQSSRLLTPSAVAPKSSFALPNPTTGRLKHPRGFATRSGKPKKKLSKELKGVKRILIQFSTRDGNKTGAAVDVPIVFDATKLQTLVNTLLRQLEEPIPYSFYHKMRSQQKKSEEETDDSDKSHLYLNNEITTSLRRFIQAHNDTPRLKDSLKISPENVFEIVYEPQSVFKVLPISRCSAEIPGHSEAILCVSFHPDGSKVATGSGDTRVRVWDTLSQSPFQILGQSYADERSDHRSDDVKMEDAKTKSKKGIGSAAHRHWVLCVAYAPDGLKLISGDMAGKVAVWDAASGQLQTGDCLLQAHSGFISSLEWEPFHLNADCQRFASGGKDKVVKVWRHSAANWRVQRSLSGHTAAVTCVKWAGSGHIYSASRDRTIRMWLPNEGTCNRVLQCHGHWVNHIALSTAHALKTGPFDYTGTRPMDERAAVEKAKCRFEEAVSCRGELLVSASDDLTLYLWNPVESDKAVARMCGHQQAVNHVCFSPNGRLIASASFDKSVRVWDALTGKPVVRLLGHVQSVYRVVFSADSRMLASASKDSTVKVWSLRTKKLLIDLPGHSDEVYDVDWSPDGRCLATGGKDRVLRLWQP